MKIINSVISKLKGEQYIVDDKLSFSDIISIVSMKIMMIARGMKYKFTRLKFKKFLFVGRKVKIYGKKHLVFGANCTLNSNVQINAISKKGIIIGDNFSLGSNSIIEGYGVLKDLGESLKIGNNVGISANAFISIRGNIIIGSNTIIGPSVKIISENHIISDRNELIRLQGSRRKGIEISENCWIGASVTILDGIKIGMNSVIAAGAIVNKDVEPFSIVGGVPAKVIKRR